MPATATLSVRQGIEVTAISFVTPFFGAGKARRAAELDSQIKEIATLRQEIEGLRARQRAVEDLQADRNLPVYLLDELVRQMPEGVFLRSVRQKGPGVELVGYAQSNARVSTLMRNIESSPWLANPNLIEIRATTLGKMRISEFNLKLALKRPTAADSKDGAKDSVKDGAKAAPAKIPICISAWNCNNSNRMVAFP